MDLYKVLYGFICVSGVWTHILDAWLVFLMSGLICLMSGLHLRQAATRHAWWIVMVCGAANMNMLLLDGMPTVRY